MRGASGHGPPYKAMIRLMKIELAPSILSANFAQLGADAQLAIDGGGNVLHVDIMDGYFVPNITIGPPVVKWLRKVIKVPFNCHLMIENRDFFIPEFARRVGTGSPCIKKPVCIWIARCI